MSRIPPIDRRALREHDERLSQERERIERIWNRVEKDLPSAPIGIEPWRPAARGTIWFAAAGATFGFAAGGILMGSCGDRGVSGPIVQPAQDAGMAEVFAAGQRRRSFALPGGGFIVLEPYSVVEVVSASDEAVRLSLLHGATSVDPGTIGVEIVAGESRVSAPAGASVGLARRELELSIHVARGDVEVSWPAGHRVVRGGEVLSQVPVAIAAGRLPLPSIPQPILAPAPLAPTVASRPPAPSPPGPVALVTPPGTMTTPSYPAAASWMVLAGSNQTKEALEVIERSGGLAAVIQTAQSARELMLLWEIASAAQRFDLQVQALDRVVTEFGSDPNASVAAITLAGIYEQKDPALAAQYREKGRKTKHLTEVTLCQQIEADEKNINRVDAKLAAETANEYLRHHSTQPCAERARRLLRELEAAAK